MQRRMSIKPSIFLFVVVLASLGCGLPTSFGEDEGELETATARAERATALAESLDELESQMEDIEETKQANQSGTATQVAEQKATVEAEIATANAIVDNAATQDAIEQAAATGTSAVIQPTLESLSKASGRPEDYPLLFLETFDDDQRDWGVGRDDSEYGASAIEIDDGHLEFVFYADKGVHSHRVPDMRSVFDFYVSVDVQRIGGDADGYYGVIFRHVDNANFYSFEVDDLNQRYWVYALEDGDWYFIFSGFSSAIKYNEVNRLAVLGEDNTFTFYVNDYQLGQAVDDRFDYGKVGIAISLHGPNNDALWQFDNLAVYAP